MSARMLREGVRSAPCYSLHAVGTAHSVGVSSSFLLCVSESVPSRLADGSLAGVPVEAVSQLCCRSTLSAFSRSTGLSFVISLVASSFQASSQGFTTTCSTFKVCGAFLARKVLHTKKLATPRTASEAALMAAYNMKLHDLSSSFSELWLCHSTLDTSSTVTPGTMVEKSACSAVLKVSDVEASRFFAWALKRTRTDT